MILKPIKEGVSMNLYHVHFADNDSGDILSDEFQTAESVEHCIAIIKAEEWRGNSTHIYSIEHIYEFKEYRDCLRRLEICINYTFAQIEQFSIVSGAFADSRIGCNPENAREDQRHAGALSFAADLVEDRLKEVKKYIDALEYMTTEQRRRNTKMEAQQNLTQ